MDIPETFIRAHIDSQVLPRRLVTAMDDIYIKRLMLKRSLWTVADTSPGQTAVDWSTNRCMEM